MLNNKIKTKCIIKLKKKKKQLTKLTLMNATVTQSPHWTITFSSLLLSCCHCVNRQILIQSIYLKSFACLFIAKITSKCKNSFKSFSSKMQCITRMTECACWGGKHWTSICIISIQVIAAWKSSQMLHESIKAGQTVSSHSFVV